MSVQTKRRLKITIIVVGILAALWVVILGTDYWRTTHEFEKPIFARWTKAFKDGGSGTYTGIGYSIEIKGNFMPEDEFPGVTHAKFMIFGREVKAVIRD